MKVPTRRWGNVAAGTFDCIDQPRLNESPHPKVGKYYGGAYIFSGGMASMKVPTRRWGNTSR